ncbi:MAG: hypothetical protein AAF572_01415 [Cyanobacteria bacterium P01_B01_bin.77]
MTITIDGNGYPIFEANQVLKYTDLNGLFNYLDAQHRLTRTHLIGIGIVCGLTVTIDDTIAATAPVIQVSPGCGITSEGYLIHLGETRLTHYQTAVAVPARLFAPTAADDADTPSPYTVVELYSQSLLDDERRSLAENPNGSARDQDAVQDFLADQVLVVVCEPEDEQRDSCLVDCDDRGKDRSFRTRFFMLPRTQGQETADANLSAERLLRQGYQIDTALDVEALFTRRQDFWQAFELRVQRFGYTQETPETVAEPIPVVRLGQIKTYDALLRNYYDVCDRAIDAIATVLPNLFQVFSPFFSTFNPNAADFDGLSDRLKGHLQAIWVPTDNDDDTEIVETQYAIQYFYDYLSQIVAAYQELLDVVFDLIDDCDPDCRRFPKFLMLGLLDSEPTEDSICAPPSPYRSHFTQPPLYNGNAQRVKQVQHLHERLRRLCQEDTFYLLPFYATPLKITPSKDRSVPLSQQAIPYYLNYPNLYRYWNYDACRKGISARHPAYFYPRGLGTSVEATDDLLHRLDAYNFYRIEGHIGESKTSALTQIKDYQQRYNLAFDVITLKLAPTADFDDLILSGHFDDLEADFGRLRDRFLKLWDKNEDTWSQNIFLNTLRQVFFTQEGLSNLSEADVSNQILVRSQTTDNFEFEVQVDSENEPTSQYRLYIVNASGNRIAQYAPRAFATSLVSEVIDFSGLSDTEVRREQERIASEISACLSLGKVTFGLQFQPGPFLSTSILPRYQLVLSVEDRFTLPVPPSGDASGAAPIRFLSRDAFTIIPDSDNNPIISQSPFRDFETLYGLLRDLPSEGGEGGLPPGNTEAAECLNYFEVKGLMEVYRHRLERLKELHLFYKYAGLHPGMEHLGGVPNGGTFILVYVDGQDIIEDILTAESNPIFQERTNAINPFVSFPISFFSLSQIQQIIFNRADIVVADFCLPYRCCGDTPTTNYVLEKPRPIVLLERAAFCQDDETRYEFMLSPEGGTLKGEGSVLDEADGQYYFQPSRIAGEIINERVITFTYVVDGSYDTFTVALYPEPTGTFAVNGESISGQVMTLCNDAPAVVITVTGNHSAIETQRLTANEQPLIEGRLVPSQFAQTSDAEEVRIVAFLRDRRTDCEGTIDTTFRILQAPNTNFTITPSVATGDYCAEGQTLTFQPEASNLVRSIFRINNTPISGNSLQLDYNNIIESYDTDTLDIVHQADNEVGCTSFSDPITITVYPIPILDMSLPNEICSGRGPINPIREADGEPRCQAFLLDDDGNRVANITARVLTGSPLRFDPRGVNFDDDNVGARRLRRLQVSCTVTGEGNCSAADTEAVTVYRTPSDDDITFRVSPDQPPAQPFVPFQVEVSVDNRITWAAAETENIRLIWTSNGDIAGNSQISLAEFLNTPVVFRFSPRALINNQQERFLIRVTVVNNQCSGNRITVWDRPIPTGQDDGGEGGESGGPRIPNLPIGGGSGGGIVLDPLNPNLPGGGIVNNPVRGLGVDMAASTLDQRMVGYRRRLTELQPRMGARESADSQQLAARLLTLDRTIPEVQATQRYRERITSLLNRWRSLDNQNQRSTLAELIALSTASFLDRLVVSEVTDELEAQLAEILTNLRGAGLDLAQILAIWQPAELDNVVESVTLNHLRSLLQ